MKKMICLAFLAGAGLISPKVFADEIFDTDVNLKCVRNLAMGTNYTPSRDNLLDWAELCRPTVDSRCVLIGAAFNNSCTRGLFQYYRFSKTPDDLTWFNLACRTRRYSCPDY